MRDIDLKLISGLARPFADVGRRFGWRVPAIARSLSYAGLLLACFGTGRQFPTTSAELSALGGLDVLGFGSVAAVIWVAWRSIGAARVMMAFPALSSHHHKALGRTFGEQLAIARVLWLAGALILGGGFVIFREQGMPASFGIAGIALLPVATAHYLFALMSERLSQGLSPELVAE